MISTADWPQKVTLSAENGILTASFMQGQALVSQSFFTNEPLFEPVVVRLPEPISVSSRRLLARKLLAARAEGTLPNEKPLVLDTTFLSKTVRIVPPHWPAFNLSVNHEPLVCANGQWVQAYRSFIAASKAALYDLPIHIAAGAPFQSPEEDDPMFVAWTKSWGVWWSVVSQGPVTVASPATTVPHAVPQPTSVRAFARLSEEDVKSLLELLPTDTTACDIAIGNGSFVAQFKRRAWSFTCHLPCPTEGGDTIKLQQSFDAAQMMQRLSPDVMIFTGPYRSQTTEVVTQRKILMVSGPNGSCALFFESLDLSQ